MIILGFLIGVIVLCIYLLIRNEKVYRFRERTINDAFDAVSNWLSSIRNDTELNDKVDKYNELVSLKDTIVKKYSYERLLFSIRKLTYEKWYSKEEIEFLIRSHDK